MAFDLHSGGIVQAQQGSSLLQREQTTIREVKQLPRASRNGADPGPLPPHLRGFLPISGAAFLGPPCLTECIMSAMV